MGWCPKTYLKRMWLLYVLPIILNGYLKRSVILSIKKIIHYSWLKQLWNPLSSPFYLYGGNFLLPQLTSIAFFEQINPCNFSRSLQISLKFSVNIIDPPRSWIMCKNIQMLGKHGEHIYRYDLCVMTSLCALYDILRGHTDGDLLKLSHDGDMVS